MKSATTTQLLMPSPPNPHRSRSVGTTGGRLGARIRVGPSHLLQKTLPQSRQWWRLSENVNFTSHAEQVLAPSSLIQWSAMRPKTSKQRAHLHTTNCSGLISTRQTVQGSSPHHKLFRAHLHTTNCSGLISTPQTVQGSSPHHKLFRAHLYTTNCSGLLSLSVPSFVCELVCWLARSSDYLFVCLFVCIFICSFACFSFFPGPLSRSFLCLYTHLFACLFVCLFLCFYIHLFACLFVCSFVSTGVCFTPVRFIVCSLFRILICLLACLPLCFYSGVCLFACLFVFSFVCLFACCFFV